MDANEGWLDAEKEESERLMNEGFSTWSKKDFSVFKSACERHGRNAFDAIAQELETKTPEEVGKPDCVEALVYSAHPPIVLIAQVKRYSEAFWSLGPHRLSNWETVKNQIEKGESKIQKRQEFMNAVKRKVEKYSNPWQQLKFQYGNAKGKVCSLQYVLILFFCLVDTLISGFY